VKFFAVPARHFSGIEKPLHFAGVRGEETRPGAPLQNLDLIGKDVQPIGIDHHRGRGTLDHF
jgi:hypothetical protein